LEELVAARSYPPIDPEAGIPDLIRRLADDSKRLVGDEVRLAKLEVRENMRTGLRGMLWLALAFGAGVVALVALTVFLAAGLGRLLGNYWAGALIVGALELVVAFVLLKKGLKNVTEPSYTFEESREQLKETAQWVRTAPQAAQAQRASLH
jgi:uncharacterized membrane protein YqjE